MICNAKFRSVNARGLPKLVQNGRFREWLRSWWLLPFPIPDLPVDAGTWLHFQLGAVSIYLQAEIRVAMPQRVVLTKKFVAQQRFSTAQNERIYTSNPESWSWSGSPPKSNRLVPRPRPPLQKISPKSVHNFLRNLAERETNRHMASFLRWRHRTGLGSVYTSTQRASAIYIFTAWRQFSPIKLLILYPFPELIQYSIGYQFSKMRILVVIRITIRIQDLLVYILSFCAVLNLPISSLKGKGCHAPPEA